MSRAWNHGFFTAWRCRPWGPRAALDGVARVWGVSLHDHDVGAVGATDRLVVVGPSAIVATIGVFVGRSDLDWAEQVTVLATPPPIDSSERWRERCSASTSSLIHEIAAELEVDPHDLELDLTDSPSPPTAPEARRQSILDKLTHPKSWAGYRFVGVCERRPTEPWSDEDERQQSTSRTS